MGSTTQKEKPKIDNFWEGGFEDLLKTGLFSDATLIGSKSKKEYKVHKILLVRKSLFFRKIIVQDVKQEIFMVDDPYDCLESVLTFLYTGCLIVKPENSEKLLNSAEYYGIESLADLILKNIQEILLKDPDLVFMYLNIGEQTRKSCVQFISMDFAKIYKSGAFKKCSHTYLTPKQFYEILSKDDLGINSETIAASALLDYITYNSDGLSPEDLKMLFSAIRFPFLNSKSLVELYPFQEFLSPSWKSSIFQKLCSAENISPPTNLSLEFPPRVTCDRIRAAPLRFVVHPNVVSLINTQDTPDGVAITKIGGSWWANALSEHPLTSGKHRIHFRLDNGGGQYVGVGLGGAIYATEGEFLGQKPNGWSLCSTAGHPWDGHIFNGILTNTGVPYAPPQCVRIGSTITMDVDLDVGTVEFSVGDRLFGVAWRNVVPPIHVVVSMFVVGSIVMVWRD